MARPKLKDAAVVAFRERACELAISLFAEQEDVSLRQLAKAMGCAHTTPYRYFENKEDLFVAARALAFVRFADYLRKKLAPITRGAPQIRMLCHAYLAFAQERRAEFRLIQHGLPDQHKHPHAYDRARIAWEVVERCASDAVQSGDISGDPLLIAHHFWAATHGVITLGFSERLQMRISSAALVDSLCTSLLLAHAPQTKGTK